MFSSLTLSRLRKAARIDSWRTLSNTAVADLVRRGLFDQDGWCLTARGRATLAALDA